MKKTAQDELRPEYDFASMTGGVRGKYSERYRQGVNIVRLEDDVAAAFPDAKSVNNALRSLIKASKSTAKHV